MARKCTPRTRTKPIWLGLVAGLLVAAIAGCIPSQSGQQPVQSASLPQPSAARPHGAYQQYVYAGLPKATHELKLLQSRGHLVGYSEKHKDPVWVAYRLFKVESPPKLPRPTRFSVDNRTEAKVKSGDYTNTGFDRGHMAPNHGIATRHGKV